MRRGRVGRPGLVGTMARTAVITSTATSVAGRQAERQAQRQAVAQPASAPAPAPAAPAAAPAPAAPPGDDMLAQLQQLADLKAAGVLDDAEFAAAKARVLGT